MTARHTPALGCLLLALLGWRQPALAASPPQLLSAEGEVRVDGELASGPRTLPGQAHLTVARGGKLQLLLARGPEPEALTVAVIGPARLRVGAAAAEAELISGERLMASGSGRVGLQGQWQLVLEGASAVLDGHRLHLTRGAATLIPLAPPPLNAAAQIIQALEGRAAPVRLAAGQLALLRPGGLLRLGRGAPSGELVADLSGFAVSAWRPELPRVTFSSVRAAEQVTSEQRRAERETSSCGCTEGRGPGTAPNLTTGTGLTPLEGRGAKLRVRVIGVPRSD